jgi:DNA-binding NarL/FixJ family response regulator
MPRMGGVEATIAIRKEFPEARIIALTSFELDGDINRVIESGAKSYLPKDTSEEQLTRTIRAVYTGKQALPEPSA